MCKEVIINGEVFVPKEKKVEGLEYVMVRTYSAGVFAGCLKSREGKGIVLENAREKCKFPQEVKEVTLTECIEIIPITEGDG